MFHKLLLAFLAISCCLSIASTAVINKFQNNKKDVKTPWELMEALSAGSQIRGFNGTWITDEEFYYTAADRSIHKYNAATNKDTILVNSDFFDRYTGGTTFTLSPDNSKILVRYNVTEVFRHSLIAQYDVFDIATKTSIAINKGLKLQYCTWSPKKDVLSFVYQNNVYLHLGENLENPITSEGIDGVIYNGVPDWVYEEEVLSSGSAMWWSPDAMKLVVGVFDDTNVQTFKYFLYGEAENPEYQYPKEVDLKYPKPGTPNPTVSLRLFDVSSQNIVMPITISAPEIVSSDHILQNVAWANEQTLLVTWLNRRQNIGTIQSCDVTGEVKCTEVKRLAEPSGWISAGVPMCLASGKNCLYTDWIGNWLQVWNLNLQTGQNVWTSRGEFTVLRIYGYDEIKQKLYYQATIKGDPSVYQVFSNDDCLTCNMMDVEETLCLSASAAFSKGFTYYSAVCNGPNPSYTKIFKTETNQEVKEWVNNMAFREKLSQKLTYSIEFMNVTLADNKTVGFAKLLLPPNIDKTKKYPLIVYVYGGPNSVRITNGFSVGFDGYMTTKRQVIIALIDGRGTGNKGKDLLFSVNNNLGQHEVEDQIFVTKYLQTLPYVDADRTGIWGWSYGGYMTAKTLSEDDERVFQCGVSVAPVTSWMYYDTIYTERYMGLPTPDDNLDKYKESGVLEKIENFRNHDFLLIHGSGDDNVHYQQSLMLAKVLQHNDILFEEMTYTDENHSIGNFINHLYTTMDHFWINCLNLEVEEENEV